MKEKRSFMPVLLAFIAACSMNLSAQTAASAIESKKQTLFSSANHQSTPYRIPAIAVMSNGEIIAISDQRPCGADVGNGEVDIYAKISSDGGATWNPSSVDPSVDGGLKIADGSSSNGYGDAAVVANRDNGEVMVICVAGNVVFSSGSSSKHNKMARLYSSDYGKTWTTEDVTTTFFDNLLPDAYTMFMASGRILQSRQVKVGDYYRLYAALLVRQKKGWFSKANYNYVVYSDDFGKTWSLLGNSYCISSGDEAKMEELPNGDVVISSRKSGGRYFNVFSFTNQESASGSWGSTATCTFAGSNSTNGEIILYKGVTNVSTGEKSTILLQSLPTGSSRSNVAVYYKVIDETSTYTSSSFTSGWTKGIEVDEGASAYSTMDILPNGEIGFLYEDDYDTGAADGDCANIVYVPLTVEEITGGAYTYVAETGGETEEPETPVVETVTTPVITPDGGEIKMGNSITIACGTEDAVIYYTIDGSEPTTSSTQYTGAFSLSASATVKAIAVKEGWNNSEVASATFTYVKETVSTPVISPAGGEVEAGTTVSLTCATSGAVIYYSLDGSAPATVYSAPIALTEAVTVRAIAKKDGYNNSAEATATFTIKEEQVVETVSTPVISPESGEITAETEITITCATEGATIHYTTDGTVPTTSSAVYAGAFTLSEDATVNAIAVKEGWNNSEVAGVAYTIKVEEPETPEEEPVTGKTWAVELKTGEVDGNSGYVATFSASVAVTLPDGVSAYVVSSTFFNRIYTSEVSGNTIPANTGVILYSTTGGAISVTEASADATVASIGTNKLVATGDVAVATTSSKCFVLQEKSGEMTFVKVSKGTTVAANTAYIEGSSWFSSMTMSVDGENPDTTGIDSVESDSEEDNAVYDLQGRRVNGNPTPGVYVKNGKKFLVK